MEHFSETADLLPGNQTLVAYPPVAKKSQGLGNGYYATTKRTMIRTCCIQQSFLHISPTRNFGQYFWERDSTEFRAVKTVTLTEYTSPMIPPIGVVGVGPNSDWRRKHSSLGNDS